VRLAGPFDQPRSLGFLPDGRFLVAERPGKLKLVAPWVEIVEVSGVPPVLTAGHGGLIDLALDPEFATNNTLYLSYLQGSESASALRVLRARLDMANASLIGGRVIYETSPGARTDQIGGRIAVTPDGYLFLSVGDRWAGDPAQDLANDLGSIIRIRTDGSTPDDNPFRWRPGVRPAIWSYGHRNPQGLAYNAKTGHLWSDEHGPQGGDELNLVLRGRNYGWPIITYGIDYSGAPIGIGGAREGLEQPVHYWVPVSIAPSGLAVESDAGNEIVWISALAGEMLVKLTFGANCAFSEEHLFKKELGRIRDVRIGPRGSLYLMTDGPEGVLYRVDPAPTDAAQAGARL
jgi:glucose/arabinose dehydrogenase